MKTTIEDRFELTTGEFQGSVCRMAEANGMPAMTVYELWLAYCDQCVSWDMSPSLPEFERQIAST